MSIDSSEVTEWSTGRMGQTQAPLTYARASEARHRAIVEALRGRDAEQAGQVLTGHLRQIQQNLFGL